MDEFPEDYDEDEDDEFNVDLYLTDEEKTRKGIAFDIARHMKCPIDAITDEMISEVERRGWSIKDSGPYCLFCGIGIHATLEQMPKRMFCGFCRAGLN